MADRLERCLAVCEREVIDRNTASLSSFFGRAVQMNPHRGNQLSKVGLGPKNVSRDRLATKQCIVEIFVKNDEEGKKGGREGEERHISRSFMFAVSNSRALGVMVPGKGKQRARAKPPNCLRGAGKK